MKYIVILLFVILIVSCSDTRLHNHEDSYNERQDQPLSQIYGHHAECTGCLDISIDSGFLYIPKDLDEMIKQKKHIKRRPIHCG